MSNIFFLLTILPLAFCRLVTIESPRGQEAMSSRPSSPLHVKNGGNDDRPLIPTLKIRAAPPELIEVSASESVVLECEAGGNPPPTIHWLKDGKRVHQSGYAAVESNIDQDDYVPPFGLSLTRSRLYVDCAGPREGGVYTCVAENPFHRKSRNTVLTVLDFPDSDESTICLAKKSFGSPARIHMWTHNRLELSGSDVQLFCRSDGEPQPQVTWLGPNDIPIDTDSKKYEVLENGDLVVRNIMWTDMGDYTCQVQNSNGFDSTRTFLYPMRPIKSKGSEV